MDYERYSYSNNQYPNDYHKQNSSEPENNHGGQNNYSSQETYASKSSYGGQNEYNSGSSYGTQSSYAAGSDVAQSNYGTQSQETYTRVGSQEDGTYRMVNTNRVDRSYIPQEPARKPKNKKPSSGVWKKLLIGAGVGIFFGMSAGVAFYFVNLATGVADLAKSDISIVQEAEPIEEVQIPEQTPVSESGIDMTSTQTITTVVTDVTEVVENVMPAVVSITNIYTETTSFWGQNFSSEAQSSGSGIIVNENEEELLIVTNYHVVADADTLKVQFINESVADAQVKGADSNMDLAVIAVRLDTLDADTKNAISLAKLGDSDSLKVGEPAIAIGNALGYGQSVTTGVISALDRQIEISEDGSTTGNLIQTDAAINPGNSGGALLNVKGEVIGINSNKIGGSAIEGMGYAIPISSAEPIIENLMLRETKDKVAEENKGYLGISGINVTSDVANMYGMPQGVYVTQVYEGTAAADAGMLNGDIITGFEGSGVGSMEDLQGYLEYYEKGESVEVTVMRTSGGEYKETVLTVVLGEAVQTEPQGRR